MTPGDLEAFRRGEDWIFRRLVREHSPRLIAYLRDYAPDQVGAEELTQSVWVRAFERRQSFRADGTLLGWLLSIARSLALDDWRRERRMRTLPSTAAPLDVASQPEDPAERAERAARVRAAVLSLPPRQRDTVVLRVLDGLSTKEAADWLGCAEGTVKAALHQALARLTRELRTALEPEEIP